MSYRSNKAGGSVDVQTAKDVEDYLVRVFVNGEKFDFSRSDLENILASYTMMRDIAGAATNIAKRQIAEVELHTIALEVQSGIIMDIAEERDNYKSLLRSLNDIHKPIGTSRRYCVECNGTWPCGTAQLLDLVSVE